MTKTNLASLEANLIDAATWHDETAAAEKRIRAEWDERARQFDSLTGPAYDELRGRLAAAILAHHEAHERVIAAAERLRAAKRGAP